MENRFRSTIILPCERLARYINCFYIYKDDGLFKNVGVNILNNGYTEMLFQLGDITEFYNKDKEIRNSYRISLSGQYLDRITTIPTGNTHIISVNFKPGGMYAVFGIPQNYFTSENIDLYSIDPHSMFFWEKIMEQPNIQKQIDIIECYLITQMVKRKHPVVEMQHAVSIIGEKKGVLSIRSLADILKMSARTLNRRFFIQIGIVPKQIAEIYRLNNVCTTLLKNRNTDLLSIALSSGYYDASHLIRTFKHYLHITPAELRNRALPNGGYCDKITLIDFSMNKNQ